MSLGFTENPIRSPLILPEEEEINSDTVVLNVDLEPQPRLHRLASDSVISAPPPPRLRRFASDPITQNEKCNFNENSNRGSVIDNGHRNVLDSLRMTFISSTLISTVMGGAQSNVKKTFYCNICLENCAYSSSFASITCVQAHRYCNPCMQGFLQSNIEDAVIRHVCPGIGECRGILTHEEISALVSPELLAKHDRFVAVKSDPNYRECPTCNKGLHWDDDKSINPLITCDNCSYVYCFFHSSAHEGTSCEEYARRMSRKTRENILASEAFVQATSKNCPSCAAPTFKTGGCNHMTCQACRTNWCWICGMIMVDVTAHYASNSLFGCPGGQFVEDFTPRFNPFAYLFAPCLGSQWCNSCYNRCIAACWSTCVVSCLRFLVIPKFLVVLVLSLALLPVMVTGFFLGLVFAPCYMLRWFCDDSIEFKELCLAPVAFCVFGLVLTTLGLLDVVWLPPWLMLYALLYSTASLVRLSCTGHGCSSDCCGDFCEGFATVGVQMSITALMFSMYMPEDWS